MTLPSGKENGTGNDVFRDTLHGQTSFASKCPRCREIHGPFVSASDARNGKLCPSCVLKEFEDGRSDLRKVVREDLEDIEHDAASALEDRPWIVRAIEELIEYVDDSLSVEDVDKAYDGLHTTRNSEIDMFDSDDIREKSDSTDTVTVEFNNSSRVYTIFRSYEAAEIAARDHVRSMLDDEPTLFSPSFLSDFVNWKRVASNINMDRQDDDDPEYDETTVQDYLRDVYGDDEFIEQAIRIGGFDRNKAADYAVRSDGVGHFLSSYDGALQETRNFYYVVN